MFGSEVKATQSWYNTYFQIAGRY